MKQISDILHKATKTLHNINEADIEVYMGVVSHKARCISECVDMLLECMNDSMKTFDCTKNIFEKCISVTTNNNIVIEYKTTTTNIAVNIYENNNKKYTSTGSYAGTKGFNKILKKLSDGYIHKEI